LRGRGHAGHHAFGRGAEVVAEGVVFDGHKRRLCNTEQDSIISLY
jgi:hypothetical protein